jgi:carnitine O-acetyltransferase
MLKFFLRSNTFHKPSSTFLCHQYMSTSSIKLTQRPQGWKAAAPGAPSASGTPSRLSKLPVLDLQETLGRLKQSLKPIAWSDSEYASVEKKIDAFGANKGPQLQERLLNRAEEIPHWLEEWWDDAAYLGYRDSVRCSYFARRLFFELYLFQGCNKRILLLYVAH